jgi:hypothetical protein
MTTTVMMLRAIPRALNRTKGACALPVRPCSKQSKCPGVTYHEYYLLHESDPSSHIMIMYRPFGCLLLGLQRRLKSEPQLTAKGRHVS